MAWTDITQLTGLVAWYKSDSITGLADADPISTWSDSSGNGNHLTSSGSARPLYKTSQINSLPVVRFDGSDDQIVSGSFAISSEITTTIVFKVASTAPITNSLVAVNDATTPTYPPKYLYGQLDGSLDFAHGHFPSGSGSNYTYRAYKTNVSLNTFYICSFNQPNGVVYSHQFMQINGTGTTPDLYYQNLSPATSGNAIISFGWSYISGRYLNGDIAEAIVYQSTNSNEKVWVEGYLADKYGITLADGHLFKNAAPENAPTTYNAAGGGASKLVNGGLVD